MADKKVGMVTVQITQSITGKFSAKVAVKTAWGTWTDYTIGDDRPFEALEPALQKMKRTMSPSKRGRRPNGWRSVDALMLQKPVLDAD